ncbi:MAG: AMP-binding protein, partial [Planctomycetaceae bacterium]|nr:AMP-binding protein [Planctomycetaceae bacterium]
MANRCVNQETIPAWVDGLTIGQVLRETARRHSSGDAIVFLAPATRMTWAEFDREVNVAARALLALGFKPGDHFGVWATNVPEWVVLQFATARIGVVLVTLNPSYRTSELKYALRQSEVRGLALVDTFKSSNFFQMLNKACPELAVSEPGALKSDEFPKLQWIVSLRGTSPAGVLSWSELLARAAGVSAERLDEVAGQLAPLDAINIQYTSGTTGHPKGATLSHRNLLLNAYYAGECQRLDHSDRVCIPVPLYHCFGCVLGTLCCAAHGAAMVFPAESFQPDATLAAVDHERCTALYGVPTMFIAQLEHDDYPRRDLSSLRTGIMAGSPCPIELMKRVTEEMGAVEITIGYGQTEA